MAEIQPSNQPYYPGVKLTFQIVVYGAVALALVNGLALFVTDVAQRLGF